MVTHIPANTQTRRLAFWAACVVIGLLLLDVFSGPSYLMAIAILFALATTVPGARSVGQQRVDRTELRTILGLYLAVVALMSLAFRVFGEEAIPGLFLSFAAALLLGTIGPIYYTVWRRNGTLADLGIRTGHWRQTIALALVFAAVQFWLTLWRIELPDAQTWVPLLVMALVVGAFEAVFFRGFIQSRLEEQFGTVPGIAAAAALYGLYHVGYGMGPADIMFLTGLGLVYGVAFALPRSVFVLWPLLTPLGSFYNNVTTGDIDLPWASIIGFSEVFAVMVVTMWWAWRHTTHRSLSRPLDGPLPEHAPAQ